MREISTSPETSSFSFSFFWFHFSIGKKLMTLMTRKNCYTFSSSVSFWRKVLRSLKNLRSWKSLWKEISFFSCLSGTPS